MTGRRGGEELARLIERSSELKRDLVDFACSPRPRRSMAEDLVSSRHGERYLREQQARAELARVSRESKRLRAQRAALEERRSALLAELGEQDLKQG